MTQTAKDTAGRALRGDDYFQSKAIESVLANGFVPDGETDTASYRAKVGELAQRLINAGGRQRFAKPGTLMKVTVGKRTVCFYEVIDKKAKEFATLSTRETDRIAHWAKTEICYMRRDAISLGRGDEWLKKNPHLVEAAKATDGAHG